MKLSNSGPFRAFFISSTVMAASSIPPAEDKRFVLRHALQSAELCEFRQHRVCAFTLLRGYQRQPSDSDPLVDIRPRDGERRRAFLDAQTGLGERLLIAIFGTRVGLAAWRTTKDYLAVLAPSLRTDDRTQHLPHTVVALPGRDQHAAGLHASRESSHHAFELGVRDELQHVTAENEIERRRLERQPRYVRAEHAAFRADSTARDLQHLERQVDSGHRARSRRARERHEKGAIAASDVEHVARLRDFRRDRLEDGVPPFAVVLAVAVSVGETLEVSCYLRGCAIARGVAGAHAAENDRNADASKSETPRATCAACGLWPCASAARRRLPDRPARAPRLRSPRG